MSRLTPLLGLLLLLSLLLPDFREFVREVIVAPLLFYLWFFYLLLASLPQLVYWALFVLAALVVSLKSLSGTARPKARGHEEERHHASQLMQYLQLLESHSEQDRWRLARRLERLTAEVLAQKQGLAPGEVSEGLESGAQRLPEEVRRYLDLAKTREPGLARRRRVRASLADIPSPEGVIAYLEAQLEGGRGDSGG